MLHIFAVSKKIPSIRLGTQRGSEREGLPGPLKYVELQPFGLFLGVQGYYLTYFWGLGRYAAAIRDDHCVPAIAASPPR